MVTQILPENKVQRKPISDHFAQLLPTILDELEAEWRRLSPRTDQTIIEQLQAAHQALGGVMDAHLVASRSL